MELALPLPSALFGAASVHPDGAWVRARHEQWSGQPAGAVVEACLHIAPHVPAERVLELSLLATMFTGVDDLLEQAGPHTGPAAYAAVIRAGEAPTVGSPNLLAFGRVVERTRRAFGPQLYPRVVTAFEQWALCMAPGNAAASGWEDLDSYLRFRRQDFGFDAMRVASEYGAGVDLTDLETSPLLDDLHTACFEHALFVNDLFSYRKETQAGDGRNAVSVLISTAGMTPQAAVNAVCERITSAEGAFGTQAHLLTQDGPGLRADVVEYVRWWRQVLGGNIAWSLTTPRYNGVQHPATSTLPTHMLLRPDHTEYRYATTVPS
ncbi:terpene synthase family protein [Allokutzneria sp. NRRL B-24872]|uniref:terpene synthase family protein n=1 Tax=Allokutzneria sp. NRRL B-24872 TaxID=1137961 RepID=UPI000A3BC516|nr:terpene synthase family protein [Allokutzneria sp. NRRL B-24872]